jgi:hypothetical protein
MSAYPSSIGNLGTSSLEDGNGCDSTVISIRPGLGLRFRLTAHEVYLTTSVSCTLNAGFVICAVTRRWRPSGTCAARSDRSSRLLRVGRRWSRLNPPAPKAWGGCDRKLAPQPTRAIFVAGGEELPTTTTYAAAFKAAEAQYPNFKLVEMPTPVNNDTTIKNGLSILLAHPVWPKAARPGRTAATRLGHWSDRGHLVLVTTGLTVR